MDNISRLKKELERAVLRNDIKKAEEISDKLFFLQGGREEYTVMRLGLLKKSAKKQTKTGVKTTNMKKIISIVAAAAVITTIGITALATRWYGI